MQPTVLSIIAAWSLLLLGVGHIAFGFTKFKEPLLEAVQAGFVGQFKKPEIRRTAFWFIIFGVPLMLAGHAAIHALGIGDLALIRIIGFYVFVASLVGISAFPKSPFPASLVVAIMLLAAGYGL